MGGFKSIRDLQTLEIRPLTILAGTNSSGKSSFLQPLLLMKQTLETGHDPGPLRLDGPHIQFNTFNELFWKEDEEHSAETFQVGLELSDGRKLTTHFKREHAHGISIAKCIYEEQDYVLELRPDMAHEEIVKQFSGKLKKNGDDIDRLIKYIGEVENNPEDRVERWEYDVMRYKCFLHLNLAFISKSEKRNSSFTEPRSTEYDVSLNSIFHLPGIRGNRSRYYPVAFGEIFYPGPFEKYVATLVAGWQGREEKEKINALNDDLKLLGLNQGITSQFINDVQMELKVDRNIRQTGNRTLVNISDVGFGVAQVLPVLVALRHATEGDLVYIEQPELHLHPRAQHAMAQILADAARRGVRMVMETHSEILLRGIQTLVAEGTLPPELVKLHWFTLDESGASGISSADLDGAGAYGDWPEDFGANNMQAESRYLDAAEQASAR